MPSKIPELKRLISTLNKDLNELSEKRAQLMKQLRDAKSKIHREQLIECKETSGAIAIQCPSPKTNHLTGTPGTILKVGRTRITADFNGEQWELPIENVLPQENYCEVAAKVNLAIR